MFDISTTTSDGATCVAFSGQADLSTHERLKATLAAIDTRDRRVELRLSAMDSCDMTNAWELLEFVREVRHNGGEVHVVDHPNVWVRAMLTILDVEQSLPMPPAPDPSHNDLDGSRSWPTPSVHHPVTRTFTDVEVPGNQFG